jgi:hypothetical protein
MNTALHQACGPSHEIRCDQGHGWCIGRSARITSLLRPSEATTVRSITSLCELTGGYRSRSVMLITHIRLMLVRIDHSVPSGKLTVLRDQTPARQEELGESPAAKFHKPVLERTDSREPRHIRGGGNWSKSIQEESTRGRKCFRIRPALMALENGGGSWQRQKRSTLWRMLDTLECLPLGSGSFRGNRRWVVRPVRIVVPGGSALSEAQSWPTLSWPQALSHFRRRRLCSSRATRPAVYI